MCATTPDESATETQQYNAGTTVTNHEYAVAVVVVVVATAAIEKIEYRLNLCLFHTHIHLYAETMLWKCTNDPSMLSSTPTLLWLTKWYDMIWYCSSSTYPIYCVHA